MRIETHGLRHKCRLLKNIGAGCRWLRNGFGAVGCGIPRSTLTRVSCYDEYRDRCSDDRLTILRHSDLGRVDVPMVEYGGFTI